MARGNSKAQSELPSGVEASRADIVRLGADIKSFVDKEDRRVKQIDFERSVKESAIKNKELAVEAGISPSYQKVNLVEELQANSKNKVSKSRFAPEYYNDVSVRINEDGLFEAKGRGWSIRFGNKVLDKDIPVREAIMRRINQVVLNETGADEYYSKRPDENPGG